MGINCEVIVQVRDPATGEWVTVVHPANNENGSLRAIGNSEVATLLGKNETDMGAFSFALKRDYIFFAKIANIGNDYGLFEVLDPRGVPNDLNEEVAICIRLMGPEITTYLLDKEIENLSDKEMPEYRACGFVYASDYERVKKENSVLSETSICNLVTRHTIGLGFFFTLEEWEKLSPEQKARELSRPFESESDDEEEDEKPPVYITINRLEKKNSPALIQIKELAQKVKTTFLGQEARCIFSFSS